MIICYASQGRTEEIDDSLSASCRKELEEGEKRETEAIVIMRWLLFHWMRREEGCMQEMRRRKGEQKIRIGNENTGHE